MASTNLTPKQRAFVSEYLIDLNGAQAAIRAGYSVKTARVTASQLLTKPNIQTAVQDGQQATADRNRCDQDQAYKLFKSAYDLAEELKQPSPMINAVSGICKLLGLNECDKKQMDPEMTTGFRIFVQRPTGDPPSFGVDPRL